MSERVAIVGVGIHPFGRHDATGMEQAVVAIRHALADASCDWPAMQFAVGGSADAGNPDTMVSSLGLTGIPFLNVLNGCATGGSALTTAVNTITSGTAEIGLVVGFDKHPRGAFEFAPEDWGLPSWYGETGLMLTPQFFGMKIQRYMSEHGISQRSLARVAAKAFRNGARNDNAWRRKPLTEEEILEAAVVAHPLTQYMFCSPGEGAVALVVCDGALAARFTARPVWLEASVSRTRRFGSFEVFSPWLAVDEGASPTVDASKAAFELAGVAPSDVQVAQLQDTESGAEIMHMAETGLCDDGDQEAMLAAGDTEIGGRLPINTDGGCLANGEPVGASGLRQVHEIVLQLRGQAGARQVPGTPKVGFTQVYGAPGISACTVLTV